MRRHFALLALATALAGCTHMNPDPALRGVEPLNVPVVTRADYVFACMKTNGETRQALEHCSCSIDVIASIIPYDRYVTAESVLSLSQVPGRFGTMFRTPEPAKAATKRHRAKGERLKAKRETRRWRPLMRLH